MAALLEELSMDADLRAELGVEAEPEDNLDALVDGSSVEGDEDVAAAKVEGGSSSA